MQLKQVQITLQFGQPATFQNKYPFEIVFAITTAMGTRIETSFATWWGRPMPSIATSSAGPCHDFPPFRMSVPVASMQAWHKITPRGSGSRGWLTCWGWLHQFCLDCPLRAARLE